MTGQANHDIFLGIFAEAGGLGLSDKIAEGITSTTGLREMDSRLKATPLKIDNCNAVGRRCWRQLVRFM